MKRILLLSAALLAPAGLAHSAPAAPTAPTAPKLGAPLITKLDWETRALTVADIDGDGRRDLALLNNDTGCVELLYQRKPGDPAAKGRATRTDRWTPTLDTALFRRESVAGDSGMLALAVGDLNGDGLADIAFTNTRGGLTIIFQGPKTGEWREPIRNSAHAAVNGVNTLRVIADTRGTSVLAQRTRDGIALWQFEKTAKNAPPPQTFPEPRLLRSVSASQSDNLFAQTLGAGKDARFALGVQSGQKLRFRERGKDGAFGPEISLDVEAGAPDLDRPLAPGVFAALDTPRRALSAVRFTDDPRPLEGAETAALRAYAFTTPLANSAQAALIDTDGDGINDLVIANPKAAVLLVRRGNAAGDFEEPREFPSLADVSALAAVSEKPTTAPQKGTPPAPRKTLFVLSEKEGILGAITFDAQGKPSFPAPVTVRGKTLHVAASDSGEFPVALVKDDNGKTAFQRLVRDPKSGWKTELLAEVELARRDITALKIADLDGDGQPDVLAFVERDPARIWTRGKDGKLAETAKDSPFRKSILENATPATVGIGVDDAGKPLLLAASQGFARGLRLGTDGSLTVAFQANTRRPESQLTAPLLLGKNLLALDNSGALLWFVRDSSGVFREKHRTRLGALTPLTARLQYVAGEKTPRLLYLTAASLAQLPTARRGLRATPERIFISEIADFRPSEFLPARFDGRPNAKDAAPDSVVLLDINKHVLEIARRGSSGTWAGVMHFPLFDSNPHYRGRRGAETQPRESLVADLTGDGLEDLVLLMHDRVLVYPQHR
jgi:hypothetical protein